MSNQPRLSCWCLYLRGPPSLPGNDLGGEAARELLPTPPAPTPAHFQGLKVSYEKLIVKFITFSQ